jgi:hypothetical protein
LLEPTPADMMLQIANTTDVSSPNASPSCLDAESFIPSLARGKLIICNHISIAMYGQSGMSFVLETIRRIGAAGVIITSDPLPKSDIGAESSMTLPIPGIVIKNAADMQVLTKTHVKFSFRQVLKYC